MRWVGQVTHIGQGDVYRILVRKPERKRPLATLKRRSEDYIKMDLQEVVCRCTHWIELAQNKESRQ
jgi:aerobic-type carbon monoxide dehydrogenase small subunit (CoxS/CutS family)